MLTSIVDGDVQDEKKEDAAEVGDGNYLTINFNLWIE